MASRLERIEQQRQQKLERILFEIVTCMRAKRGSIMLAKGRKKLKVVASTNPELVGLEQGLDVAVGEDGRLAVLAGHVVRLDHARAGAVPAA